MQAQSQRETSAAASDVWQELRGALSCPESGEPLNFSGLGFSCPGCSREFGIQPGAIADLRPRSPRSIRKNFNPQFVHDYQEIFHRPMQQNAEAVAWGAAESVSPRWARRRERQVWHVQKILEAYAGGLRNFCDFSAGAGYYTLAYARAFPVVLHCDLSCESLLYASHKAQSLGIENIAFLRIDYLQPPFAGQLDCAICMDTLERGEEHERLLLGALRRSLRPGGIGVVDFHNWWHNPARRLGLLPQNFGNNRSYTRRETEALLHSCGIREFRYLPFHQEIDETGGASSMARAFLPPTRHVYVFQETGN